MRSRLRLRPPRRAAAPRRAVLQLVLATTSVVAGLGLYELSASAAGTKVSPYAWQLPKGYPQPRVPKDNPMNAAKVDVGRWLFYDRRLSGNATQSCSSCHLPARAFTDGGAQSVGSTGERTPRSSPTLVNVAYNATFAWANPGLVSLERQMEVPLFGTGPTELGITDANRAKVLKRITDDPVYARWFRRAFPGLKRPITWTTIIRSIAAFQRSIVSASSRYDQYLKGKVKLTPAETRGQQLFMGEKAECHHCHGTFIFNEQVSYVGVPVERPRFHNTGLYNIGGTGALPEASQGLFEVTGRMQDMGRFRAPTLRNIELTAPYMHDGSIPTLEAVIDHYANGGRVITEGPFAGDGRASPFKDPLIAPIDLSRAERADLVAFLKTLTDRTVAVNPRFADPFRKRAAAAGRGPAATGRRAAGGR
ncbi:hypothetical protein DSM112329_01999 [Paraconexibacter sp. AEG42_29]|uniref:Cytochrome c domain-containing protein n=1 Tax=Paraconexibacter sp. AEG42_29 TaxID=2997339 RepID=A0AAU7AU27_9ACTN